MRAGRLDRRITLQHRTTSRDSFGQEVETFTAYATVWASKLDTRGREAIASEQKFAENSSVFQIRHMEGVLRTDRIVYGSEVYNIRQIAEVGRRRTLDILADAVVQ